MRIVPVLLAAMILACGCNDDSNCLKSTGKIITEKRVLGPFSSISVNDNIDLIFTPGPQQDVVVEAGENIIDNISAEVINYQLILKNKNKCNWLRSYDKKIKVYISQPALIELYNLSDGKISCTGQMLMDSLIIHNYGNGELNLNIQCDKLRVDTNFFGDVIFSGEATELSAHCFRLARLDTRSLKCQNATVLSEAEGDIFVYAENSFSGTIKSKGNVYYSGNPASINLQDQGEGNFIQQ